MRAFALLAAAMALGGLLGGFARVCLADEGPSAAPSRFFEVFDRDRDGRVTFEEFGESREVFDLLDADGDGAVTPADLGAPADERPMPPPSAPEAPRAPGGDDGRRERLIQMDADGDGRISREEFQGRAEIFERLDRNGDGFLDAADRRASGGAGRGGGRFDPQRAWERLRQMDEDGDGKVSREEFPGPDERFDQMDRNGDGFLDEQDVRRGPGGPGGPGAGPGGGRGGPGGGRGGPGGGRGGDLVSRHDRDGNGKLSRNEFEGSDDEWRRLDANQDGWIDRYEAPR